MPVGASANESHEVAKFAGQLSAVSNQKCGKDGLIIEGLPRLDNSIESSDASLVPVVVTSRHSGEMASVLCTECGDMISFQKSCSDKFCSICNERRRRRLMRDYQKEIEKMEHPKFLTLTLKSQSLSRDLLKRIRQAFTRLTHRKNWRAKGGFYVIELGSLKETGLWNVHIHAVMDSEYMPQKWISEAWLESTGDSMVVDIRQVRSYRYATWYLTKYVGKPIVMNRGITEPERNFINAILKGSRLIQRFGNCIHVRIEKHRTICRKCGATNSYISVEIELEPSIRAFDKTRGFKECQSRPLADALESYNWWTFETD